MLGLPIHTMVSLSKLGFHEVTVQPGYALISAPPASWISPRERSSRAPFAPPRSLWARREHSNAELVACESVLQFLCRHTPCRSVNKSAVVVNTGTKKYVSCLVYLSSSTASSFLNYCTIIKLLWSWVKLEAARPLRYRNGV